jgi:hypothetical protein
MSQHPPRKHEVRPELGITEEVARRLDKAMAEMETGNAGGVVQWDESGETWGNIHASDIGTGSQTRHKGISSNEQVMFASLVEREKNTDPSIEHGEAYARAAEKVDEMEDNEEKEKK